MSELVQLYGSQAMLRVCRCWLPCVRCPALPCVCFVCSGRAEFYLLRIITSSTVRLPST